MSDNPTVHEIPNRFDHNEAQPRLYATWEQAGQFHSEPDESREPFTIVIPPPNVTGALHLGHALNNSLQDIVIRFRRMQGMNTLWMPGTDHAGIATQAVVERRLLEEEQKSRHDLGREKLVERIWQWKDQYEKRIIGQLKQMGCSCDWERTHFTLDEVCAAAVRRTFFDLFEKQLIYRGKRLVNWDTYLQTAVSDDEVFHEAVQGHFWHIDYPVVNPQSGEPERVTIATTRPETMLGDTALAVHPDPAGALDKIEADLQQKLATAAAKDREALTNQLENIQERRRSMLPHLELLRDMALDGRHVLLPLLEREIPLVADVWAKPEMGSGCVKITPAHDPNDYDVAQRCHLPMINILNSDGTLNENAGPYAGLTVSAARERVVNDLQQHDLMGEIEDREIDLAHSDRSKTPIEPYLADQWFVRMNELAQSAMDAVTDGRVKIIPPRYSKGYLDWLGEKRDWPVSRQLWWGHQIPIWSQTCPDLDTRQNLTTALEQDPEFANGRICYHIDIDPENNSRATIHVSISEKDPDLEARIEQQGFHREEDVLDTWFSSALWPHSTLGWPEQTPELAYYYPTSVLITSRDIITLWVARMVLTGLNNMGDIPFHKVFIHPKILDGYGETMSKSKGNGVDPLDVIEKFGADALRFGLAHLTTETQDVRMPVQFECPHCHALIEQTRENRTLPRIECTKCNEAFSTQWAEASEDQKLPRGAVVSERFELSRNFCNKLWNATRFALLKLPGYEPGTIDEQDLRLEDRWLLSRLATVTGEVTSALEEYRYSEAARALYEFSWDEFCSFYIEMVKGRLGEDVDPKVKLTAQRVLAHALDTLMRLLHPMIPFITEEIWQLLGQAAPQRGLPESSTASASIMDSPWPVVTQNHIDSTSETRFSVFQQVLSALREIRSRQNLAPRKSIQFSVRCDQSTAELLDQLTPYFESMASAAPSGWGPDVEPPTTRAHVQVDQLDVFVDLAGLIDIAAEHKRVAKELDKTVKMAEGKRKKLDNANFVERAPQDVVQRERASLEQMEKQIASLQADLAKLEPDNN